MAPYYFRFRIGLKFDLDQELSANPGVGVADGDRVTGGFFERRRI